MIQSSIGDIKFVSAISLTTMLCSNVNDLAILAKMACVFLQTK